MSIQAVNNTANNPYLSSINTDFQNLQNDLQAYENSQSSESSGSSTQVTLSQQALTQAMTQFQNDFASLSQQTQSMQGAQSAQGHHHHHHHGMDVAGSSGNTPTATGLSAAASNSYGPQTQSSISSINLTV